MNTVALVNGVPQTLSLKSILEEFILHRVEVIRRRTQFDLNAAEAREHILLGLKKALDHIDEIIKLICASKDVPEAQVALIKKFKFTVLQANCYFRNASCRNWLVSNERKFSMNWPKSRL